MEEIAGIAQYGAARTARTENPGAHIDRARGGQVTVKLIIPPKRIGVQGGQGGFVDIPKQEVSFTIDLEQLPLVNVARYNTTMTQVEPLIIPYPTALPNAAAPLVHTFT
jgi:hypothetical protein